MQWLWRATAPWPLCLPCHVETRLSPATVLATETSEHMTQAGARDALVLQGLPSRPTDVIVVQDAQPSLREKAGPHQEAEPKSRRPPPHG